MLTGPPPKFHGTRDILTHCALLVPAQTPFRGAVLLEYERLSASWLVFDVAQGPVSEPDAA